MTRSFEPDRIIGALERHRVRYVAVGGFAAVVHGSAHITTDLDIVPDPDLPNLERLAHAIRELAARVRPDVGGFPFQATGRALAAATTWSLTTRFGDLDITFEPAGTGGYADLRRDAVRLAVGEGVKATIASLEDVVRSKEAAGRDKDRLSLPVLRRILEEQARESRSARPETRR
jgi:hypothetical protein